MGVGPLHEASYLAPYEEIRIVRRLPYLSANCGGPDPPAIRYLLAEFMKYLLHRGRFYYPQELPARAIAKKAKEGHIDRKLWIPLEDLRTGWATKRSGWTGGLRECGCVRGDQPGLPARSTLPDTDLLRISRASMRIPRRQSAKRRGSSFHRRNSGRALPTPYYAHRRKIPSRPTLRKGDGAANPTRAT